MFTSSLLALALSATASANPATAVFFHEKAVLVETESVLAFAPARIEGAMALLSEPVTHMTRAGAAGEGILAITAPDGRALTVRVEASMSPAMLVRAINAARLGFFARSIATPTGMRIAVAFDRPAALAIGGARTAAPRIEAAGVALELPVALTNEDNALRIAPMGGLHVPAAGMLSVDGAGFYQMTDRGAARVQADSGVMAGAAGSFDLDGAALADWQELGAVALDAEGILMLDASGALVIDGAALAASGAVAVPEKMRAALAEKGDIVIDTHGWLSMDAGGHISLLAPVESAAAFPLDPTGMVSFDEVDTFTIDFDAVMAAAATDVDAALGFSGGRTVNLGAGRVIATGAISGGADHTLPIGTPGALRASRVAWVTYSQGVPVVLARPWDGFSR
jgi:hypothetical protein